ncbi:MULTISPECIES: hypothetical protein [unclassified Nocardiopsis]|uniref:hypothetical protein n=1 Tax=unclassified Nocardiopsis TaxID=2649073 RepID=UPI001356EC90|nr:MULTISPECIES: hypothetical protein [unclassified Nocardiopsis]
MPTTETPRDAGTLDTTALAYLDGEAAQTGTDGASCVSTCTWFLTLTCDASTLQV